jgi:hypothetical protein
VAAEAEASRVPVEGAALPVEEISGPGPESDAALGRLRSDQGVDPSIVMLGESINERVTTLRERVADNALRTSASLQGEAETQRAAIQGSIGASQAAVGGIMEGTRASVAESKGTALETLTQQGESAHARNAETGEAETGRLQENIDGSVEEARTIFSDADQEVGETGEREAGRGRDYAHDLARRARELGTSEAARYRRTEEDSDLGDDKADAVIDVANRFARQLEGDGDSLHSDVLEQTEEAREQVTAEEEPTVSGLEEVGPGAVESIGTFFGSIDEQVDSISEQGQGQLEAAETGALAELDNLDQAVQGRGEAMLAEGEGSLDAGLTAGLLAQTNLAGQAGQLLNDTSQQTINQLTEVATTGAAYEDPGEPAMIQRDPLDAGVPLPGGVSADDRGAVLGQLDQMGPALDQAADSQTTDAVQSLGELTSSTDQAASSWVGETQGQMDSFATVADTGLTQVTDGANTQLDNTITQGATQATGEVDRISQDVTNNVDQVRQSIDGGVNDATANLEGGVDEGNAHSDETYSDLPSQMHEAAEAQESLFGSIGNWFSEQLADTWQAIKGMADWGFLLDLAVGIVAAIAVGLLVVAALTLIGVTGGLAAALIVGAAAGAAGFAAGQISSNVRTGKTWHEGVGHAALLGAFVGAGGAIAALPTVGLIAGTGVVMLAAGVGTVVANLATGRSWDEHLVANILILGIFHAIVKGTMDRIAPRLGGGKEPPTGERRPPPAGGRPIIEVDRASFGSTEPEFTTSHSKYPGEPMWVWYLFDRVSGAKFCEVIVEAPDPMARPAGGPDLNLYPQETTLPSGEPVTLAPKGFSWTPEALRAAMETYARKFGRRPPNMSGEIERGNLANFQSEFVRIRESNPGLSVQEIANQAIRLISFGKHRIAMGYGNLSVRASNFADVTVKGQAHTNVPTKVLIDALPTTGQVPPGMGGGAVPDRDDDED